MEIPIQTTLEELVGLFTTDKSPPTTTYNDIGLGTERIEHNRALCLTITHKKEILYMTLVNNRSSSNICLVRNIRKHGITKACMTPLIENL